MLATTKKYAILRAHLPNMTETEATSDTAVQPSAGQVDLTELRMMPAWVAGMGSATNLSKYEDREERGDRPAARGPRPGGRDRRDGPPPRRDGGGGGKGGEFRPRGDRRDGPPGERRDRRDGPRRHGEREHREPRERVEVPQDIQVVIEPRDVAVEALAGHIRTSGHAFSMFDAARLVLADGERFQVRFTCDPARAQGLFKTAANGGLYLSREEALSHLLRGPAIEQYYRVEEIELEEPKGDFKSVGVCGISGELLGPPNHHSFQTALLRLHRERFSNMPLEDYKRRVRTESGEEVVAKWKEQQRKGRRWVYIKDQPEDAEPVAFSSRADMETHFRRTHGDDACPEAREAIFTGNPEKGRISHPLFLLARNAVEAARKHLFEMSQKIGGGFERRGLKLFKRRAGKLYVSRVKPRLIDPGVVFSERVARVVEVLKNTHGIAITELVEKLAPAQAAPASVETAPVEPAAETAAPEAAAPEAGAPAAAAESAESPASEQAAAPAPKVQLTDEQIAVLKDIRWLANEGYVIEYSDGMVFLGVQGEPPSAKPKPEPAAKKAAAPTEEATPVEEAAPEDPDVSDVSDQSDTPEPAAEAAESPPEAPAAPDTVETAAVEPAPEPAVEEAAAQEPAPEAAAEPTAEASPWSKAARFLQPSLSGGAASLPPHLGR